MLQQILKDMYIDPDVLEALNDDQKKTLFLKMRQEQVRRWKEREEKLEKEGADTECKQTKPKKANSKSVSWLPGRDGDVAVIVIGEVDELSSKFICSGFGGKTAQSLQNNAYLQTILKSKTTTDPVRAVRENLPPKTQVSVSEHSSPPAAEKPELKSPGAAGEKSVPQSSICSRSPMRTTPFSLRPAFANVAPGSVNMKPEVLKQATTTPPASLSNTATIDCEATTGQHSQKPNKPQESQSGKGTGASEASRGAASEETGSSESASTRTGRGRVAQLMKTFNGENTAAPTQIPSRGIKPPLPTKPNHLRLTTTPTVR